LQAGSLVFFLAQKVPFYLIVSTLILFGSFFKFMTPLRPVIKPGFSTHHKYGNIFWEKASLIVFLSGHGSWVLLLTIQTKEKHSHQ